MAVVTAHRSGSGSGSGPGPAGVAGTHDPAGRLAVVPAAVPAAAHPAEGKVRALNLRSSASVYGPERTLLELAPALKLLGVETSLMLLYRPAAGAGPDHPILKLAAEQGLQAWQAIDAAPWRAGELLGSVNRRAAVADIVHAHDYKADFLAWSASRLAERVGKRRVPWVATSHLHTRSSVRLRAYRMLDLQLLRQAAAVFTVSAVQARALARRGVSRERLRVAPTVIDADAFARRAGDVADVAAARRELGVPPDARHIVAAGRLARQKGFDVLLAALPEVEASLRGVHCTIAGEGPERGALERAIAAAGVGATVRLIGYRSDMAPLLATADAVTAPSRAEGLPLLLLEAMALGRPVVATRVGGVPEVIRDGGTGILVEPGDAPGLAAALIGLLSAPSEAERVGTAGARFVREHHSPRAAAEVLAEAYRSVLRGQTRSSA